MELSNPEEYIKDSSDKSFLEDVVQKSETSPVIVDFWAPWCEPCKTLGPILIEETKKYNGKISLVKINVDENQNVAGQLRVQSIPAVFVFVNGQPVDGFMGNQTKSHIQDFLKKISETYINNSDINNEINNANDLVKKGEFKQAKDIFNSIIEKDQKNIDAYSGIIKINLHEKNLIEAKKNLSNIPEELKKSTTYTSLEAKIKILEESKNLGDVEELRKKVEKNPGALNHKFDLAMALINKSENEEAIELFLQIFSTDPNWKEGKSKSQLLKLLDSLGPKDNLAKSGRRRLSSLIFS